MEQRVIDRNAASVPKHERLYATMCAGGGGSAAGYAAAGFKCKLAVEWDTTAARVFKRNFPDTEVWVKDLWGVTAQQILEATGLKKGEMHFFDASPPCQDHCKMNNNPNLESNRTKLYEHVIHLIRGILPMSFNLENTDGMLTGKSRIYLNSKILPILRKMGYYIKWKVVHANEHGCPQSRKRFHVIGVRMDIFNEFGFDKLFPDPDPEAMKKATLKSIIPDVIASSPGQYQDRLRDANLPVNTVTRSRNIWLYRKDGSRRRATGTETMAMMGFPPDFDFMDLSENQIQAILGNAVTPKVSEAIGRHLIETILTDDVLDWLREHPYKDE